MVKRIKLLEDFEEVEKKKGDVITVYEWLAIKLVDEKKAEYAIIKNPKEGEDK